MTTIRSEARLQETLDAIARLLEKHRVLDTLAARQEGSRRDLLEHLQHRQNLAELHKFVRATHAADLAVVLEALPPDDRRTVWEQASVEQAGHAFVEVSNVVREWLVESTPRETLVQVLTTLDPEDLGYVAESIPPDILRDVSRALASADRQAYEESIQYAEDRVGHHMSRESDSVMDFVRAEADWRALKQAGLTRDEDLFARPWDSARNRWPWLAINLVTAFVAARVIGRLEGTIASLSALATLMPIVASIGGNTGNQTMAIVIRALAVDQLKPSRAARVLLPVSRARERDSVLTRYDARRCLLA